MHIPLISSLIHYFKVTYGYIGKKLHILILLFLFGGISESVGYYYEAGKDIITRQQFTPVYHRNGAACAVTRKRLVDQKTVIGSNTSAIIIDGPLVNIDTEQDLKMLVF
jgi:CMP-N-acetylneuraminic acid synthetase